MRITILDNIEPFNELYFESCFFNSFFPVVNHFSKDITSYLVNNRIIYQLDDNDELRVKYLTFESAESIMRRQGIGVETRYFCSDLIPSVIKAIEAERPVIIWSDYYYNPLRTDVFHKEHGEHTLMVYGFDEARMEFQILEHTNRDSLNYSKQIISYNNLEITYNAYREFNAKNESYFEFYLEEAHLDKTDHFERYKNHIVCNKDEVTASLSGIINYLNYLADRCLNGHPLIEGMDTLNAIVNAKKVESYTLFKLREYESTHSLYLLSKELVEQWSLIRSLIYKLQISRNSDATLRRRIQLKLKELQLLEKTYYKYISAI